MLCSISDQNDEKTHHDNHDKVNSLLPKQSEKTEKNCTDVLLDLMEQKKDVKRQTEKLKPRIKKVRERKRLQEEEKQNVSHTKLTY